MNLGKVSKATKHQLLHMLKHKEHAYIHDRIRVVLWGLQGQTAKQIADRLDRKIRWVQLKAALFRDNGIIGLFDRLRTGQPQKLPEEMTEKFCERLRKGPQPRDNVSVFQGKYIQKILFEEFGCKYSVSGIYKLLHRLRFSWVTSRPIHEKNNPETMKTWLSENKNFLAEVKKTSE